jgi:hypothetical protein
MDDKTQKFIEKAHAREQLTIADAGIEFEVEPSAKWSVNGRYSGSDMRKAFDAGRACKPDDNPTEVFENCVEDIQQAQDSRRARRKKRV